MATIESLYALLLLAAQNDISFNLVERDGVETWTYFRGPRHDEIAFKAHDCPQDELEYAQQEIAYLIEKNKEEAQRAARKAELLRNMSETDKEILGLK